MPAIIHAAVCAANGFRKQSHRALARVGYAARMKAEHGWRGCCRSARIRNIRAIRGPDSNRAAFDGLCFAWRSLCFTLSIMLIAVVACVLGIIVENYKWPQDRTAVHARFIESDRPAEKLGLLVGLVLNHSVVRWLIAFAVAAVIVLALLEVPTLQESLKRALYIGELSANQLDALLGATVAALMTVLSIAARRIAA
jgi:hypothetical protein